LTLNAATERSAMKWRRFIGFDYRSDVARPNEKELSYRLRERVFEILTIVS
jgi:hypothetical protein